MPDLTLKRLDAAIRRVGEKNHIMIHPDDTDARYDARDRAMYTQGLVDGMRAAQNLKHARRSIKSDSDYSRGWDAGHDSHQNAIRGAIAKVKKEIKDAKD